MKVKVGQRFEFAFISGIVGVKKYNLAYRHQLFIWNHYICKHIVFSIDHFIKRQTNENNWIIER